MDQGAAWLSKSNCAPTGFTVSYAASLALLMMLLLLPWPSQARPSSIAASSCPPDCRCLQSPKITTTTASCASSGLLTIPHDLPASLFALDLSRNSIRKLGRLSRMSGLQFLDASHNRVEGLGAGSLEGLGRLRTLNLSFNAMSVIEEGAFASLVDVQEVDLAFNALTELDAEQLYGLDSARSLNLSHNLLSRLSNQTFLSLPYLHTLDLSHNQLQHLPDEVFRGLTSVTRILLHHNLLLTITGAFNGLENLQILEMSNNRLEGLDNATFIDLPKLATLDLSFNNISYISAQFCGDTSPVKRLSLAHNPFQGIDRDTLHSLHFLQALDLSQMPYLSSISVHAFEGAVSLQEVNASRNPRLSFIHPQLFSPLTRLRVLDLRWTNVSVVSHVAFLSNPNLTRLYLANNPLTCGCAIRWMLGGQSWPVPADLNLTTCWNPHNITPIPVSQIPQEMFQCNNVSVLNSTEKTTARLASQLLLRCDFEANDPHTVLTWSTPRGLVFHYHPYAASHLLSLNDALDLTSAFHAHHHWHRDGSYDPDLRYDPDHVTLLSDGSLFLDFVLRTDAGPYRCTLHNAQHNASSIILVLMDPRVLFRVKIASLVVGLACAATFFTLNTVYVVIMWIARRLVNKRRRQRIQLLLASMDDYRSSHIQRIRSNYHCQLARIRDHYHYQSLRLRENYATQMKRVRQGYSHQVERIRDNYHARLGHLKEYSSHQIQQIREATNHQMVRIRDYGTSQMERLRESCKLQQQHVLKVLEAMNLENCKTVVEADCLRAESMIFNMDFPDLEEEDNLSSADLSSHNDSEYATALNSHNSSKESLETVVERRHAHTVLVDSWTVERQPLNPASLGHLSGSEEVPPDNHSFVNNSSCAFEMSLDSPTCVDLSGSDKVLPNSHSTVNNSSCTIEMSLNSPTSPVNLSCSEQIPSDKHSAVNNSSCTLEMSLDSPGSVGLSGKVEVLPSDPSSYSEGEGGQSEEPDTCDHNLYVRETVV